MVRIENLKKFKISYMLGKTLVLFIICSKYKKKDGKIFKEEESIEILNILSFFQNI